MSKKDEYRRKLQAQLEQWEAELKEYRARAVEAGAEAQAWLHEELQALEPRVAEVRATLSELSQAGEETWARIQQDMEPLWASLSAAFDRIRAGSRADYQQKMQAQFDAWSAELDGYRTRAVDAGTRAQEKLNEELSALEAKIDQGRATLVALAEASEEKWETLKEEGEFTWQSVSADLREARITQQARYKAKLQAQLEEWDAELKVYRARAAEAGTQAQQVWEREMQALEPRIEQGKVKMAELEQAREEAWEVARKEAEFAWSSLKTAVNNAREQFKR